MIRTNVIPFLQTVLFLVIVLIAGGIYLTVGYWLSDVVYDAGLWPIGALMRIVLLFSFLGYGLTVLMLTFLSVRNLVIGDPEVKELQRIERA